MVDIVVGVGGGRDVGGTGIGSRGQDTDDVGVGKEPGKGIEAVGVGGCRQEQRARDVVETDLDAGRATLAGVDGAVVVVVEPDLVAQGEVVEAKVDGQVRVGVGVAVVDGFIADGE